MLVNYIRKYQIDRGVPNAQAYNVTMYVLAGMLVIGLICNLMVKPVDQRYWMTPEDLAAARAAKAAGERAEACCIKTQGGRILLRSTLP